MIPVKKSHEHGINTYLWYIVHPVIQTQTITKFTFFLFLAVPGRFALNEVFAGRWKEIEGNFSQDSRIDIHGIWLCTGNYGQCWLNTVQKTETKQFKRSFRRVHQISFQRMGHFALKFMMVQIQTRALRLFPNKMILSLYHQNILYIFLYNKRIWKYQL